MQERIPLVIDTDMAYGSPQADIDDAVALLFALASPEFDLLAVSAAGGNAAPGCVSRNLDSLLRLVSADIPHSFSCSRPIDPGFWVNARWSSSPAKPAARSEYPDLPDSVQLLYSTLSASAEPVTLVTIGPMTNTALLGQEADCKKSWVPPGEPSLFTGISKEGRRGLGIPAG